MTLTIKQCVEIFHLTFLRQFSTQIESNLYAIKGGCNLRFFFDSARYSEDLDLDVFKIAQATLENKVNKLLHSINFLKSLRSYGVNQLDISSPKQTPTTQRWKIQLATEYSEIPYRTKIEFSRRNKNITASLGSVGVNICRAYRLPPLRLTHYELSDAISQKILALAHRSLTQARDIFDLYHLLHIGKPMLSFSLKKETLSQAEEALFSISFNDFKSQVVNFLEPDSQLTYDNQEHWQTILNKVLEYLNGLAE